jgi:hypothetical protein
LCQRPEAAAYARLADKLPLAAQELEAARLAKQNEYKARVEYIGAKVEEAGVCEQHRRQGLLDKLERKMARAELVGAVVQGGREVLGLERGTSRSMRPAGMCLGLLAADVAGVGEGEGCVGQWVSWLRLRSCWGVLDCWRGGRRTVWCCFSGRC